MSEHRGFAVLLWSHSHTQCFTHTPWHSTAVTPFLAFQQSSAVEALSRGLHKLGLCFYPGENSRSLYYNLPADWSDGCASTAAVQGTREQGSHVTLPAEMVLVSVAGSNCVCLQQEGSVFLWLLHWASPPSEVSVYQLGFIELVFGRLPSLSLPSHLHSGSLFPQLSQYSFLSNIPFFTLSLPSIRVGSIPAPNVPQQGDSSLRHPLTAFKRMLFLLGARAKPFLSHFYYLFLAPGRFSYLDVLYFQAKIYLYHLYWTSHLDLKDHYIFGVK